jgi:hypothetical protein
MEARIKLEGNKVFSKMAKEIPLYAERFALVNTPDEYYIIVAFIDLFEFIFRLYKTKMINEKLWFRWKSSCNGNEYNAKVCSSMEQNKAKN